jgi:hypothetical protein
MPDREKMGRSDGRKRLRSVLGILVVILGGLVFLTFGGPRIGIELPRGVGMSGQGVGQILTVTIATVPLIVLAALLVVTTQTRNTRLLGLSGIIFALFGIAIGLPFGFRSVGPVVAVCYGGGLLVVGGAILNGMRRTQNDTRVSYRREEMSTGGEALEYSAVEMRPTDGGEDDSDLSFLLEEDE